MRTLKEKRKIVFNNFTVPKDFQEIIEKQDKQFIKDIEEIIIDRGRRAFPEIKRLSGFEE